MLFIINAFTVTGNMFINKGSTVQSMWLNSAKHEKFCFLLPFIYWGHYIYNIITTQKLEIQVG